MASAAVPAALSNEVALHKISAASIWAPDP